VCWADIIILGPACDFPIHQDTLSTTSNLLAKLLAPAAPMPLLTKRATWMAFLRRNAGYIFIFGVFFLFFQVGFRSGRRHRAKPEHVDAHPNDWTAVPSNLSFASNGNIIIGEHPIPKLMEEAEEKFRKKLSSQSKTLKEAVAEYRRRYRRAPPKGFDEWWKFAMKNDVKMTDEYDGIMNDLKPFYELSGEEIRRRSEQVGRLPSIDLVRIRNGSANVINIKSDFKDSEVSARANGFSDMLLGFIKTVRSIFLSLPGIYWLSLAA